MIKAAKKGLASVRTQNWEVQAVKHYVKITNVLSYISYQVIQLKGQLSVKESK